MKPLITTVILVCLPISITSAQEFAPIGAKWYVELAEPEAENWSATMTNESIRDTIVKGFGCKVIFKSQATIFNEIQGEYILCQSGDSIMHYIPALDSLNLVMDFGTEVGESWESFDQANNYTSFGTERNYKYIVDSISYLHIDNDSLRVQHLTVLQKEWNDPDSLYYWDYGNKDLVQHLGFMGALLPTNGGDGFTDDIFETEIRCYEDTIIGLINLTEGGSCITSSIQETAPNKIKVFPNPASNTIFIENNSNITFKQIIVFNHFGKIVKIYPYQNNINLDRLDNGIYILQLKSAQQTWTERLIVLK